MAIRTNETCVVTNELEEVSHFFTLFHFETCILCLFIEYFKISTTVFYFIFD